MSTTIDKALVGYLRSRPPVAALVQDRIRPDALDQKDAYPAIAFTVISTDRDMTQDGPSGVVTMRFQFDCYASTAAQARLLADALRVALIGRRGEAPAWRAAGVMVDVAGNSIEVQAVFPEDEDSNVIPEDSLHWRRQDFTITHLEE